MTSLVFQPEHWGDQEMCLVMCSLVPVVFDKAWTGNNSDDHVLRPPYVLSRNCAYLRRVVVAALSLRRSIGPSRRCRNSKTR